MRCDLCGSALIVVTLARDVAGAGARMSRARQTLGKTGEDLACRELERRGYAIVARRYRRRGGELDIIARDGATLVFVEVKAREGRDVRRRRPKRSPALKRRRMAQLALDYLARHRLDGLPVPVRRRLDPCRREDDR